MMKIINCLFALGLALALCGCEDNDNINHTPAAGMGALGIDNETSSDLDVFIDGTKYPQVNDWSTEAWDLQPGVYRMVLNDRDGDRSYSSDIDILIDNVTEVTVTSSLTDYNSFVIDIHYEN